MTKATAFRVKVRPRLTVVPMTIRPNPDVTRMLETFRQLNDDGRLSGIAVVSTNRDGGISSAFDAGSDIFRLAGAVEYVAQRIAREL